MRTKVGVLVTVIVATVAAVVQFAVQPASGDPPGSAASYRLTLSGAHEVPANPHGGKDRGTGSLSIDAETGEVCYEFDRLVLTAGEALPHAAHIHLGDKGVAGGIVVHLFGTGGAPPAPTSYPTPATCVTTTPANAAAIVANPHGYYVNLHNAPHPSGVVRDQLRG